MGHVESVERDEVAMGDVLILRSCPSCDSRSVTEREHEQRFVYGDTELRAMVPVFTCADCELQWTDHRGEVARTKAVEKHLKDHGWW